MALNAVNDVVSFINSSGQTQQSEGPIPGATSSTPLYAANPAPIPVAPYQQIVEPAASTGLTVPSGATIARIENNGSQPVRWRDDGTAPTATTGNRLAAGAVLVYNGSLSAIRFIREAAGVTLDISFYR